MNHSAEAIQPTLLLQDALQTEAIQPTQVPQYAKQAEAIQKEIGMYYCFVSFYVISLMGRVKVLILTCLDICRLPAKIHFIGRC